MVFESEKQRKGFFGRLRDLKTLPMKIEKFREDRQEKQAVQLEREAVVEQAKLEALRKRLDARVHLQRAKEGRLQLIKQQSDELEKIKKEESNIKSELFKRTTLGKGIAGAKALAQSPKVRKGLKKAFSEPKRKKGRKNRRSRDKAGENVFGL